jgi:hypothetical protein
MLKTIPICPVEIEGRIEVPVQFCLKGFTQQILTFGFLCL